MTTASIDSDRLWRSLARLAVPATLSAWLKSSFLMVDTFYAGRLGTVPLAALAAATLFGWVFQSLSQINSLGAMSLAAQRAGADDPQRLQAHFRRALELAAVLGFVVSLGYVLVVPQVLIWQGLPPGVGETATEFLQVLCLLGPAFWLYDTLERMLQGTGDARTPLVVTVVMVVSNMILDPLLAFGYGPIPALGLSGIALATGSVWLLGAFALGVGAWRKGLLRRAGAAAPAAADVWRIGWPAALASIAFDLIWLVLMPLIGRDGPAAMAAVNVGHNLESIGFLASVGVGTACTALVGQAVGAKRWELVRPIAVRATLAAFVFNGLWSLGILAAQPTWYSFFTSDPEVVAFGRSYVTFAVSVLCLQAVGFVIIDAFAGVGRTLPASLVTMATYGLRLPLAFWLSGLYGAAGVFATIGLTAAVSGLVMVGLFFLWMGRPGYLQRALS